MFNNKKAIIFDLDGTLIDSIGMWNEVDGLVMEFLSGHKPDIKDIGQFRDTIIAQCKTDEVLEDYFDVILTRDDVENTKPNPEVYNKIADKLRTKKTRLLNNRGFSNWSASSYFSRYRCCSSL